jgi:hypothetical protein
VSKQSVQNKPTAAFALSLVGGILAIIAGAVLLDLATALFSTPTRSSFFYGDYSYDRGLAYILGGVGIWVLIASIILIVGAVKLNSNPLEHTKWGVIILVFSILMGVNIFGIIGGALALAYKPITYSQMPSPPQVITRICPQCGRVIEENTIFCPYCGKQLT